MAGRSKAPASPGAVPSSAGLPGARFIDPGTLARIDNLELVARTVVTGFINGLHRSPYLGFSLDFAEHRPYMPGDDIRRIDWRLYARTDRFYVKLFEAETNANFVAALDVSRSMDYASGEVSKLDYARFLAATLTYFSRQQKDRVGLITFDRDVVDYVPPSAKHLEIILHTIDRATGHTSSGRARRAEAATSSGDDDQGLTKSLYKTVEVLRRRGIVVVISDFYEDAERAVEALTRLRYAGHDVIVFHVLDRDEVDFPFDRSSSFEDLESGERIPIIPEKLRQRYHEMLGKHTGELSRRLTEQQIDYRVVNTAEPLDEALFGYLSLRYRLSRTR